MQDGNTEAKTAIHRDTWIASGLLVAMILSTVYIVRCFFTV